MEINESQRRTWIANLKIGDFVLIRYNDYSSVSYRSGNVESISTIRKDITVKAGDLTIKFNQYGSERVDKYRVHGGDLYEPTPEALEEKRRLEVERRAKSACYGFLEQINHASPADLVLVAAAIRSTEYYAKLREEKLKQGVKI